MAYLRLLGGASLEGPLGPLTGPAAQRHRLALLALLAVAGPGGMRRDKLLAYLWPEKDQRRAGNLLRQAVYHVRRAVGREVIESSGGVLVLLPRILSSDVQDFREAADAGRWSAAVKLYRGPFLDGFHLSGAREFDRWASQERRRLADRYRRGLEHLARSEEASGQWTEAVRWWKRRVAVQPTNSRAVERLMQAMDRSGNPAGALAALARHEAVLDEDLGVSPPSELLALMRELSRSLADKPSGAASLEARSESTPREQVDAEPEQPRTDADAIPVRGETGTHTDRGTRPMPAFAVVGILITMVASAVGWAAIHGGGDGSEGQLADPGVMAEAPDGESVRELSARDHLLQGNEYVARQFSEGAIRAAIDQYRRAVELDPTTAEAWRRLIQYGVLLAAAFGDEEAGHQASRDMEALSATRLRDPEASFAEAAYLHYGQRAYAEAHAVAQSMVQKHPDHPEMLTLKGATQMRRGDLEGAIRTWERAMDLGPREAGLALSLGHAFRYLGRYDEAERYYRWAVSLAPDAGYTHAALDPVYLARGETEKAREVRERAWERGVNAWLGGRAELYDRDYREAVRRIKAHPQSGSHWMRAYRFDALADAYGRLGDSERHALYADSLLAAALEIAPQRWDAPQGSAANLGWLFAGLALQHMERTEEALEHVRRGLALEAPFEDALTTARMERTAARAFVRMGLLDEALDFLEAVRTVPVALSAFDLRNDPEWDPLRNHPRFERLAQGSAPEG